MDFSYHTVYWCWVVTLGRRLRLTILGSGSLLEVNKVGECGKFEALNLPDVDDKLMAGPLPNIEVTPQGLVQLIESPGYTHHNFSVNDRFL